MVIGMAERNGRIHLESMSNRRLESIKPVLDAKLAEDTRAFLSKVYSVDGETPRTCYGATIFGRFAAEAA
jgi:hypothetical protein